MAIKENVKETSATGRRWFFGTNVAILILLILFVVIALNLIGHRHNVRYDMAGGFASYRLSERSKTILDKTQQPITIQTVYTSDEPEKDRKKYLPKLQDLCEEIEHYSDKITIEHLHSGDERAKLRNEVVSMFETAAQDYRNIITEAENSWEEARTKLAPLQQSITQLLEKDSWLSGFTTLANIDAVLIKDMQKIDDTREEINDLVTGETIPRFEKANDQIRGMNNSLKSTLEDSQEWMKDMNKLVNILTDPNSKFAADTKTKLNDLTKQIADIKTIIGDPSNPEVPDDCRPILQQFADLADKLTKWLVAESGRVEAFVNQNPAIERHPRWTVQMQQAIFVAKMPLPVILDQISQQLTANVQSIRQILGSDVPKDQLQNVVRQLRKIA
ncbi:MAG: hypothetical protein JSV03_10640, partial [Planctomycetota bacterium]